MGRVLGGGGGAPHSCPGRDSLRGGSLRGSLGGPLAGSLGGPLGGSPCENDHLCGGPAPLGMGDLLVGWVAGPAWLFCAGGGGTGQDM